jgi:hypothetical protein
MPFVTIKVTGLNELNAYFAKTQSQRGTTRRDIHEEAAQFFLKDALSNVHVITGRTKASTKISSVSERNAIIESGFGAPFEERRQGTKLGTTHKFMTLAATNTTKAMPEIIRKHYDKLLTP